MVFPPLHLLPMGASSAARARADAIMLDSSAKRRLRRLRSYALVRSQEQPSLSSPLVPPAQCFPVATLPPYLVEARCMSIRGLARLSALESQFLLADLYLVREPCPAAPSNPMQFPSRAFLPVFHSQGMEEAARLEFEQAADQHRNANGALMVRTLGLLYSLGSSREYSQVMANPWQERERQHPVCCTPRHACRRQLAV